MLTVKKILFVILSILMVFLAVMGILAWRAGHIFERPALLVVWIPSLIVILLLLNLWFGTKCPKCKKHFVAQKTDDEDLGVSSNAYTKKVGDSYRTYEKHKYRLRYKCISCGHEWKKIVERERQLD